MFTIVNDVERTKFEKNTQTSYGYKNAIFVSSLDESINILKNMQKTNIYDIQQYVVENINSGFRDIVFKGSYLIE